MRSEEELIEDVLGGKMDSFEPLIRPYRQGILSMAYRMTGNLEEAKEICQEALVKILKYLKSFKKGRSFKSWLFKVVMNASYDFIKREVRYKHMIEEQKQVLARQESNPEKSLLDKEIKERVQECLQLLTPKEKAVFLLRDGEGLSIKEAAYALGCSSLSVRTHLSRARSKIRVHFEKIYPLKREA